MSTNLPGGRASVPVGSAVQPGRASARPASPAPASPKKRSRGRTTLWIVLGLVVALAIGVGWYNQADILRWSQDKIDTLRYPPAAVQTPTDPSFTSKDRNVMLMVPDHARDEIQDVRFEYVKKPGSVGNERLPFKQISKPVDISAYNGKLVPGKIAVSLKYDPKLIPKGFDSRHVGMVVKDETLGAWIPISGAVADPTTNIVTAIAPHFSEFATIALDPSQKSIDIMGMKIPTDINPAQGIQDWFSGLVSNVSEQFLKDLLGQVDVLECNKPSKQVKVTASSSFSVLKACAQANGKNDKAYITNGFAFPLLSATLPTGITVQESDVAFNGTDLVARIRSAYWGGKHQLYLSGASRASVSVGSGIQNKASFELKIDDEAAAFDIGLAVLAVIAPPTKVAEAGITAGTKALLSGKQINGVIDGMGWFSTAVDLMDCITARIQGSISQKVGQYSNDDLFTEEGYKQAADVAYTCLSIGLDALNLDKALSGILSSVKVIPETLSSIVYTTGGAVLEALPSQLDAFKQEPIMVNAVRIAQQKPDKKEVLQAPPAPKQEPAPVPTEANGVNITDFDGTWYVNDGYASLSINKQWRGTFKPKVMIEKSLGLSESGTFNVTVPMNFSPGADGALIGSYGVPTSMHRWSTGKKAATVPQMVKDRYRGKSVTIFRTDNKHVLRVSPDDVPFMGQSNMCDKYANQRAGDGRMREALYVSLCNQ